MSTLTYDLRHLQLTKLFLFSDIQTKKYIFHDRNVYFALLKRKCYLSIHGKFK